MCWSSQTEVLAELVSVEDSHKWIRGEINDTEEAIYCAEDAPSCVQNVMLNKQPEEDHVHWARGRSKRIKEGLKSRPYRHRQIVHRDSWGRWRNMQPAIWLAIWTKVWSVTSQLPWIRFHRSGFSHSATSWKTSSWGLYEIKDLPRKIEVVFEQDKRSPKSNSSQHQWLMSWGFFLAGGLATSQLPNTFSHALSDWSIAPIILWTNPPAIAIHVALALVIFDCFVEMVVRRLWRYSVAGISMAKIRLRTNAFSGTFPAVLALVAAPSLVEVVVVGFSEEQDQEQGEDNYLHKIWL